MRAHLNVGVYEVNENMDAQALLDQYGFGNNQPLKWQKNLMSALWVLYLHFCLWDFVVKNDGAQVSSGNFHRL